jgi:hypothetical protein
VLYALGSLIALVSFVFVAIYLLLVERESRKFYGSDGVDDDEASDSDGVAAGAAGTGAIA